MPRILFTKEGNTVWISHLDLMRLLGRAFRRAGLLLKHSQGYSPHPELSVLLPLSVGVASRCEMADFTLDESSAVPSGQIAELLNPVLPEGIRILSCYEGGQKAGRLGWLRAQLDFVYDGGVPEGAEDAVSSLLRQESLIVEKHGKKGPTETDIAPMIRGLRMERPDSCTLLLDTVIAAQNPTLNPLLLPAAVKAYLPELAPDFVRCRRVEVFDGAMAVFR